MRRVVLWLVVMTACRGEPQAEPTAADVAAAQTVFTERCARCHGALDAGVTPTPTDFGNRVWQATVTDRQIEQTIVFGGAPSGKSAAMPPNPDLEARPGVVRALRAKVRGFSR